MDICLKVYEEETKKNKRQIASLGQRFFTYKEKLKKERNHLDNHRCSWREKKKKQIRRCVIPKYKDTHDIEMNDKLGEKTPISILFWVLSTPEEGWKE